MMEKASLLAQMAVSRAQIQRAISTARACGDFYWVHENRLRLEDVHGRIEAMLLELPSEVIAEARELTNASI